MAATSLTRPGWTRPSSSLLLLLLLLCHLSLVLFESVIFTMSVINTRNRACIVNPLWPRPRSRSIRPRPHSTWPRPRTLLASLASLNTSHSMTGPV